MGAKTPGILIENQQEFLELKMLWRRTRPPLNCKQVCVIEIIGREETYPTKRQDQQRQTCRTGCGSGEVPMSGPVFVLIMMARVVMARMGNLRMRVDAIVTVRIGMRNLGHMKVGKVVTVVMVMENRAAPGCAAGVKEDHRSAARSGKDRLPVSEKSARSVHHRIIRLWSSIGLH